MGIDSSHGDVSLDFEDFGTERIGDYFKDHTG